MDSQSRLATFELTSEATIRFIADLADFFLVRLPMRVAVHRLQGEVGAVPGWQKGFLALVGLDARSPSYVMCSPRWRACSAACFEIDHRTWVWEKMLTGSCSL